MDITRRNLLSTLGITTAASFSGCSSLLNESGNQPEDNTVNAPTATTSQTPDSTPTPDQQTQTPQEETETPTLEPEPKVSNVDFKAWENQEKRQELREVTPETWVDNHLIDTASSPIIQNFSSGDEDDNHELDLTALQLHHHDSYTEWDWVEKAVEAIDNPETLELERESVSYNYPPEENHKGGVKNVRIDKLEEAETYEQFHKWAFGFMSNYEWQVRGKDLHSSRDQEYAAFLQETVNRYAQNFDAHIWSYDTEFGRHGFMSAYSKSEDEVKIDENIKTLDTVGDSPIDGATWNDPRLIEKSPYTDSDNNYWHPVQFADGEYNNSFWEAKREATAMFANIGGNESRERKRVYDANFAPTTGFVEDVMKGLGTYNLEENNYDFETDIRNNALTIEKLRRTDGEFIVDEVDYADDQIVLEAYDVSNYENSEQLLENVWNDESRSYDNFGEIAPEFEQGDHQTLEQAAQALEAAS